MRLVYGSYQDLDSGGRRKRSRLLGEYLAEVMVDLARHARAGKCRISVRVQRPEAKGKKHAKK